PHPHAETDQDRERTPKLGLPGDGQDCETEHAHQRPRTYSTMAWICSSVSIAPKPGMRPVPCEAMPYRAPWLVPVLMNSIISDSVAKRALVDPPVRFQPSWPCPGTPGSPQLHPCVWQRAHEY